MKTTSRIATLLSILTMVFLTSCDEFGPGCVRGNNRIARESRPVGSFDEVECNGSFVVEITTGSSGPLKIEGDENLLSYIETYVQGNRLVLETRNGKCIRSNEPIHIYVSTPMVKTLKMSGSGVIYCDHITTDNLFLNVSGTGSIESHAAALKYIRANISGSGTIEVWGRTGDADLTISGSGLIKTLNLQQYNCYADISGTGNIYAKVLSTLDVTISGSGNVYYDGDPEIRQSITGTGSVRKY